MKSRGLAVAIVLALSAVACSNDEPTTAPTPPGTTTPTSSPSVTPTASPTTTPTPSPTSSPTTAPPRRGTAITYIDNTDIWVYNVAADTVRRITTGTAFERLPQFRSPTRISFVRNNQIRDIGTTGGNSSLIVSALGTVHAYRWSPDRRRIAFVAGERHALFIHRIGGSTTRIRTFPLHLGRGTGEDDHISVHWSPDGTRLLVTDTFLDSPDPSGPARTVFVTTTTGADVVPSRLGTFAIWAANGRSVYYRKVSPTNNRWVELNVNDNNERTIAMTRGSRRPALSLDGRFIAHDNPSDNMDAYVYDIRARTDRRIRRDGLAAVWITGDRLVVTDVRACSGEECGPGPQWVELNSTTRVSLGGGARDLSATSTLDSDVLIQ